VRRGRWCNGSWRWALGAAWLLGTFAGCVLTGDSGDGDEIAKGGGGGAGGGAACATSDQCPATVTQCLVPNCTAGTCVELPKSAGSLCEDNGRCTLEGECKAASGQPCTDAAECFETDAVCFDDVCCNESCAGVCRACDVPSAEGFCFGHPAGTDPENDCTNECDGIGNCADGNTWWAVSAGNDNNRAVAVAVDSAGAAVVGGRFTGIIDFGSGVVEVGPLVDDYAFVVKLDFNGNPLWSKQFGLLGNKSVEAVAVGPSDEIVVAGYYYGSIDIDADIHTNADVNGDAYVAKFSSSGALLWSHSFTGLHFDDARALAIDSVGIVMVGGDFNLELDVLGTPLSSTGQNDADAWVARLGPDGVLLWADDWGGSGDEQLRHLAFDSSDNIIMSGYFGGPIDFGGGAMTAAGSDVFIVKLDETGAFVWNKKFGAGAVVRPLAMQAGQNGGVIVGGYFDGDIDFGDGVITSNSNDDAFIVALDAAGELLWYRVYSSTNAATIQSLDVDDVGNIVAVGAFTGDIDLGNGIVSSAAMPPGEDAFALKITPDGMTTLWAHVFSGSVNERFEGVAIGPDTTAVVVGHFSETFDANIMTFSAGPTFTNMVALKLSP
jgi:hypothetical protein